MSTKFYLGIIIGLLLISGVLIFVIVKNYSIQISQKEQQLQELQEAKNKLQLNYDALKSNYGTLKSGSYSQEDSSHSGADASTQQILAKMEDFETTVKSSMDWFKQNSNLNYTSYYVEIKNQLKKCLSNQSTCNINLYCIYEINRDNGITYQSDDSTVNSKDFLQSLDSIYEKKGGDCEDFSLLYAAEYNYLVDQCQARGFEREQVQALTKEGESLGSGMYMYPVCGGFDPGKFQGPYEYAGHCVVALTDSPIISSSDIYFNLKGAYLVEPQNGEFMFKMGENEATKIFSDDHAPDTLYYLSLVITPDDLKSFYAWNEEIGWQGYKDFQKEIEKLKKVVTG